MVIPVAREEHQRQQQGGGQVELELVALAVVSAVTKMKGRRRSGSVDGGDAHPVAAKWESKLVRSPRTSISSGPASLGRPASPAMKRVVGPRIR